MHFQLALNRKISNLKKRVLVVCSSGVGTAKYLLYKIYEEYKDSIDKIETCKYYELDNININDFDIILSTIPIDKTMDIPVVNINYFLDRNDIKKINKVIYGNDEDIEFVKSCFEKDLFFIEKDFNNKEEVIKFMCNALKDKYFLPDDFYDLIISREEMSSTDIGKGIALPHTTNLVLDYSKVVICHLKKPIFWGKQHVNIVFLLGIEKNFNSAYKLFEKVFFNIVNNSDFINRLINKPSFNLFVEELVSSCTKSKNEASDIFL